MTYRWQHVLSARPTKRTNFAQEPHVFSGPDGCVKYEFPERDENGILFLRETHDIRHDAVKKGLSGPPLHIHLRQTERFYVEQGIVGFLINGKQTILSPGDSVTIVKGSRHRYYPHPSSTEDISFGFCVDPETGKIEGTDNGIDEVFFHNFAGYLMDCQKANMKPSIFQLLVLVRSADMILTPPFWVPTFILVGLHYILARIVGEIFLGYKPVYPEYSHAGAKKAKTS